MGVGGRTIAEAQENMTFAEVQSWVRYREKRGGFNVGLRLENAIGLMRYYYAITHKANDAEPLNLKHFLPYDDITEDREPTFDEAREAFGDI